MKIFLIILLSTSLWSLDPADISKLRKNGVEISTSSEKASRIPKRISVKEFIDAKELDFNQLDLRNGIPNWVSKMDKLELLDLSGTNIQLQDLKVIENLRDNLSVLILDNNPNFFQKKNIKSLAQFLESLSLTEFSASNLNGDFADFNAIGTSLTGLNKLNLSNNKITKGLNFLNLSSIKNLETLNFSGNGLEIFSTAFLPKSLKNINLSNNNIGKFDYTGNLIKLTSLDLRNNNSLKIDSKYMGADSTNLTEIKPSSLKSKFSAFNSKESYDSSEYSISNPYDDSNNQNVTVLEDLMYQDKSYTEKEKKIARSLFFKTMENISKRNDEFKKYCKELTYNGYSDWRIVSDSEIKKIFEYSFLFNSMDLKEEDIMKSAMINLFSVEERKKFKENPSLLLKLKKVLREDEEGAISDIYKLTTMLIFDISKYKLFARCVRDK